MQISPLTSTAPTLVASDSDVRKMTQSSDLFSDALAEESSARKSQTSEIVAQPGVDFRTSFMDGAAADGVITGDEMIAFRDKHAKEAKTLLRQTLRDLGISSSSKFTITRDPSCRYHVSGDLSSEDRKKLEDSLNSNAEFDHAYSATSSVSTLLEEGKHSAEFAKAYEKNPKEALARFAWLIGANWDCSMSYDNEAMDFSVSLLP